MLGFSNPWWVLVDSTLMVLGDEMESQGELGMNWEFGADETDCGHIQN